MSNVFSFIADVTGHKNLNISGSAIPLTNATGEIPGPLSTSILVFFPPFLHFFLRRFLSSVRLREGCLIV